MKTRLKINGIIIFFVILSILILPEVFLRNGKVNYFDEVAQVFGMAFIILGQIFRASARGFKSERSQGGEALVKEGPYCLVRNPMYLGILFIGLGFVLMLFQWWVALIFLFIFIIRYILLIFKEEKKLMTVFGDEYSDYSRKVARILPSLVRISGRDISEYLPLKLPWLKKEIGTMLAVLFIALFLKSFIDIKYKGINIYLQETLAVCLVIVLFICISVYLINRTESLKKDVSNKSKTTL